MSESGAPSERDLGAKVSIRLHDPAGGYRDLLGTLVSINSVQKKDGSIHIFDQTQIAIWKVVPSQTTMKRNK